jgi:hypothetical protein
MQVGREGELTLSAKRQEDEMKTSEQRARRIEKKTTGFYSNYMLDAV